MCTCLTVISVLSSRRHSIHDSCGICQVVCVSPSQMQLIELRTTNYQLKEQNSKNSAGECTGANRAIVFSGISLWRGFTVFTYPCPQALSPSFSILHAVKVGSGHGDEASIIMKFQSFTTNPKLSRHRPSTCSGKLV